MYIFIQNKICSSHLRSFPNRGSQLELGAVFFVWVWQPDTQCMVCIGLFPLPVTVTNEGLIGIPYKIYNIPGGDCYWAGAQPKEYSIFTYMYHKNWPNVGKYTSPIWVFGINVWWPIFQHGTEISLCFRTLILQKSFLILKELGQGFAMNVPFVRGF